MGRVGVKEWPASRGRLTHWRPGQMARNKAFPSCICALI